MKEIYNSLEELMSSCATSTLKSFVSSVLRGNEYIAWSFVSASVDGDICRSEFASSVEGADLVRRLSCKITPRGECRHTFICGFAPAVARGNFNR